jgi:eukaryotic-like serine/threonine-protein kinase
MSDRPTNLPPPVALKPGDKLGAYRIERAIGSGGMADVFYAVHEGLRRPAAIKVLRASLATDDVHLQRFMQEARAAASLIHPNIVQVYDVGQEGVST